MHISSGMEQSSPAAPAPPPNLTPALTFSYKDIIVGKLVRAVASSVFSQLVILVIYVLLANIDIFHPLEWMSATLNTFTYLQTWLFVVIFSFIIFAQCIICAKDYVFMSSYSSTRFQQLVHIFSVHNFIVMLLHVIIGGALIWMILSLVGGENQGLVVSCERNYCLNNETFFLIIGGFLTGFYYFLRVHVNSKHLIFPIIQQKKFQQLRSNLSVLFKDSFSQSIFPTIYFSIFYYLQGDQLEAQFMSLFHLNELQNESSVLLYVYAWWFNTIYFFSMNLMRFFFYLFLTENVNFPLSKGNPFILTLQEAVVMKNLPIVQNLACLDLFLLSQCSVARRQVLFTLSQPGGHPHNWNSLVENLLQLFNEYTNLLKKSTESVNEKPQVPSEVYTPFSPVNLRSPESSFRGNLRNMSCVHDYLNIVDVTHNLPQETSLQPLKTALYEKLNKISSFLKTLLGINFLFGELPEVNIQRCLGNGYLIIWASQGIAELAAASLTEDKYGIVQKDLPVLITTLVQLKQSLDKLNKVPALSRKVAALDDFNYKMKNAVAAAVKRSLLSICLNFGEYFSDLTISRDALQYLQVNIMLKS